MLKKSKTLYFLIILVAVLAIIIPFKISNANAKVDSIPNHFQGTWVSQMKSKVNYLGSKEYIWDGIKLKLNSNHAQIATQDMESKGNYNLNNQLNFTSVKSQSDGFYQCIDKNGNVVYLKHFTINRNGHSKDAIYYTNQSNKKDGKLLYRQG
ncbi:hypothetical protein WR164_05210 [Philodulcilactobacillus myokoensis]|uniref:Uncharacterized protein n=1 Tax=Philodulcilactobacillus myokoensis TaxID=2929573 RepID=A0A9W6B0F5_9LACO|nr:hypothetical protein [Philodulcilactobacillus myokoensis]GLB46542.1 hypothetical protein WR164_05210 [Philodulcilactobacillus myokoensis]